MTGASSPDPKTSSAFDQIVDNYHFSVEGFRTFLSLLSGHFEKDYDRTRAEAIAKEAFSSLSGAELKDVKRLLRKLGDGIRDQSQDADGTTDDDISEITESAATVRALNQIAKHLYRVPWEATHAQLERLYRSVLTGLVGQFEVLVADVAHEFFSRAPGALDSFEQTLSIADLRRFGSIDNAIAFVVDRKVDALLADSLDGWDAFFAKRLNLSIGDHCASWDQLRECVQRRHIIMHAGGNISRRYLENVDPQLVAKLHADQNIGAPTKISESYILEALDNFHATGVRFALAAWSKLAPEERPSVETFCSENVYDLLVTSRWHVAGQLSEWIAEADELSQSSRLIGRFNYWLCKKRQGDFESVKPEIVARDMSALETRFRFARLALLEENDAFFELLGKVGSELDDRAWDEWPILDEMRADPRFHDVRARYRSDPDEARDVGHNALDTSLQAEGEGNSDP